MKRKIVMSMFSIFIVASVFASGCSKKEEKETNKIEDTKKEEENVQNSKEAKADLVELESFLPIPKQYFLTSGDIDKDSYISWQGEATVTYRVYDEWTAEEFNAYKKALIEEANFTDVLADYDSPEEGKHFYGWTEDGRFYVGMGETEEQGRKFVIINATKDNKLD